MGYVGGKLQPWFKTGPTTRALRNMVRVAIHEGKRVAEENTPVETGDLRANWKLSDHISRHVDERGRLGWKGEWYNDVEYAAYVEHGTGLFGPEHRKYLILPKKPGGVLHWVDRLSGEDVFARAVLHPGSPGNHMNAIAASIVEATFGRLAQPVLRNWAKETLRQNPYATVT